MYDKSSIILNKGADLSIMWQKIIDAKHFDNPREMVKLSDYVMNQQNRLLGESIHADIQNPLRTPTIDGNLDSPGVYTRRVGRPRYGWVKENCRWI